LGQVALENADLVVDISSLDVANPSLDIAISGLDVAIPGLDVAKILIIVKTIRRVTCAYYFWRHGEWFNAWSASKVDKQ